MNFESYFSNLSCWEEFEMKCDLLGKKKNDPEILKSLRKIESWYLLIIQGKMVFLNENGNIVNEKNIEITYDFDVSCSEIESLEGCPRKVRGSFYCGHCPNLKSLKGCPKHVGGSFYCTHCPNLKSLEGCPREIRWNFYCRNCLNLKSLKGCPEKIGKNFSCSDCQNLTSLEGCPKKVVEGFWYKNCPKIPKDEIPNCEIGGELYR